MQKVVEFPVGSWWFLFGQQGKTLNHQRSLILSLFVLTSSIEKAKNVDMVFINPFICFFKAEKSGSEVNLLSWHLHTECWHPAAKLWLSVGSLLLYSIFISFCTIKSGYYQTILIPYISRKLLPKSSGKHCNNFSNKILLFN